MVKKWLCLALASVMMLSTLAGCGGRVIITDSTKVGLQPALTKQEVLDYYAVSMNYDTVVTRNTSADVNKYVLSPITDQSDVNNLTSALGITTKMLAQPKYTGNDMTRRYLSETMYNYIRALLNDKSLSNGEVVKAEQAQGYYFVDVEYDVNAGNIGTFTQASNLLGINGAFKHSSAFNTDSVDNSFLTAAERILNEYFRNNGITATATLAGNYLTISGNTDLLTDGYTDENTGNISDIEDQYFNDTQPTQDMPDMLDTPDELADIKDNKTTDTDKKDAQESKKNDAADSENKAETGDTADADADKQETGTENGTDTDTDADTEPVTEPEPEPVAPVTPTVKKVNTRRPQININKFNSIVGSGHNSSYIPELSNVYNYPAENGQIQGIGLYPCGGLGLTLFGFDRSQISGKITIRYLYKENLVNPDILTCENIYVTEMRLDDPFADYTASIIPEFLTTDFEELIDRADRLMVNNDTTGLMSCNVFNDIGMAVLRGYEENNGSLLRQISTLRRVISRDIASNAYLVEVETFRREGDETADRYAAYKDRVYAVIQQEGSQFVISDWMIVDRTLVTEPDIDPDAATAKRIVALGLTGTVSDSARESATALVNALYKSSSDRVLNGPYTDADGNNVERGMYDCFNSNNTMLSASKREEINSHLRSILVKHGTKTQAQMTGKITEFIGGTNKQVEFTTEELVTYSGRNEATYMTCYYLISCIEDVWVIDDLQILTMDEVSGEGLQSIQSRLAQ